MRNRSQWVLVAVATTIAAPGLAPADTWSVSGRFTTVSSVRRPPHRPQVQRIDGSFAFTATLEPDGSYEITGPLSSCELPDDAFGPRGRWDGSERALLGKALRATVRTIVRGCDDRSPVRVRRLSAGIRLAGATLFGRVSAKASLRVPIRPAFVGRIMLRGRVTGTRTP
jgi:hypothetical protein